jgi:hypothetical protein
MLKLNRLLLEVITSDGRYGADISFADGLNVIRADNSAGKSTCLQGAMYALGLEPMLGPRHEIPLPHAMTDWLDGSGGQRLNVVESKVVLEATNREGGTATFERFAKREGLDHRLVFVRDGHALSDPGGASVAREFFARGPGSATHEHGLGRFLMEFIGWRLPTFAGQDEMETRLYLESVFPLLFVEQKRGWGGIHRFVPPYAQVVGVRQRAFEFLLRLDVLDAMQRRMELQRRQQALRRQWQKVVAELKTVLRSSGVLADALPEEPLASWPPAVEPRLVVASGAGEWQSVFDVRQALRTRLEELQRPLPTAGEAAPEVEAELRQLEERLTEASRLVEELEAQIELEREQSETMQRRVKSISADELRYRDALTIQRYGGSAIVEQITGDCPTCGQDLPEVLNPEQLPQPMPLGENLEYLREQRSVFEGLVSESSRLIEARLSEREALYENIRRVQRQIRSSRSTLVAPEDAPAEAFLRERLDISNRLDALDGAEHAYELASGRLEAIANEWAATVAGL